MKNNTDPYSPPKFQYSEPSWWERLKQYFEPPPHRAFARGQPMMCCGVLFYLNPLEPEWLTACLPSTDLSQARMQLLVEETLHALPLFLTDFPRVRKMLEGRALRIMMIASYESYPYSILPPVELDERPIAAALKLVDEAETSLPTSQSND